MGTPPPNGTPPPYADVARVRLDVEGAELHVLHTLDWETFRFGVLIMEISCIDDPRGPLQNQTRALLRSKGYSFLHRHSLDEVWGDESLDWVRAGALKLNGGRPQSPQPCMPPIRGKRLG